MGLSTNLAAMAKRKITREGQSCTVYFMDKSADDYDPSTGTNTPSAPVAVASKIAILDLNYESKGSSTYFNTLIEDGDMEGYLMPADGFPRDPDPTGDYVVDSKGVKWRIKVCKGNNPSGSLEIMYRLMLRR